MQRHFPATLTRHSYWLAVLIPLLLPLAWSMRDLPGFGWLFAWVPLLVLYVVLPALDLLIGRDAANPESTAARVYPDTVVPVAAALVYLPTLAWSLYIIGTRPEAFAWPALAGWALSLGDIGGIAAINVAHELIHRRDARLRRLGGLLLACVWYPGFKLEHPRWHHVHVATEADPSSAPRGSTVYGQVPRAWLANSVRAWKLGAASARARGRAFPALRHEVAGWYALSLALTLSAGLAWGAVAGLVFLVQGLAAAGLLEVINYVEHYGLRRQRGADGKYEPPGARHSWDCDFWLSNAILIQLPRHADHHTHPGRAFSALRYSDGAPMLPLGYPLLVIVAMVPAWWRRLVHPHLPDRETGLAE